MRSILLICHFFPPSGEVGALRPRALAEHLGARGHRVTVVTTRAYGELPDDRDRGVHRSYDLQLLAARLRGGTVAPDGFAAEVSPSHPHPLSRVLVPDAYLAAWAPFAWRLAAQLARRERFDCVITTSPPESAHMIGSSLARRGIPWLADLQDGWSFEVPVKEWLWKTRAQHRFNAWLERRFLSRADAVTTVSRPLAADLRRRLGIEAGVVTLGWEPADFEPAADGVDGMLDPERVSIVYTGRIRAAARDPRPLMDAIARVAATDPAAASRLELVVAGTFTAEERELLERDVAPARVRMLGRLPRPQALALQRAADVGLLLTPPRIRYQIPAKTFEYLGAGAPILALAESDNAAAELVRETESGAVVPFDDPGAIAAALVRIAREGLPKPSARTAARFTNEALIAEMEDWVERAITRAGA